VPTPLLACPPAELGAALGPGRARHVFRLLRDGLDPFDPGAGLPTRTARPLRAAFSPTVCEVALETPSPDGTRKLLVRLGDGRAVEVVVLPSPDRTTLCVSSQVGCGRGCTFCRTAQMGRVRNLGADELVAQVVLGTRVAVREGHRRPSNLVVMGMGEPLDNLEAVETALRLIADPAGLGLPPRRITVSTVGTTEAAIARAAGWPCRLAWSLHAADEGLRRRLVPTARLGPEALRDAFYAHLGRGRALFVEVVLLDGVNDGAADAERILALFAGAPCEVRVNLLPMNPIGADGERGSPPDRVEAFQAALRAGGLFAAVRRPRGVTELAACGQLAVLGGPAVGAGE
jgi:23S rRNA (adenine2503-C2)-methyltransferase